MPFLRQLRDSSRETAHLGVLDDGEVIAVAQLESREIIRAMAAPGCKAPVMTSGTGKAIGEFVARRRFAVDNEEFTPAHAASCGWRQPNRPR